MDGLAVDAVDTAAISAYARGFVLSEDPVDPPDASWSRATLLGLHLTRAPEVPLLRAEHAGSSVVVLGHLVDTAGWRPPEAAVTAAAEALARSGSEFLDLTDAWSGRYLLLFGDGRSTWAMTDASGMRAAFHTLDGPFVLGSHARLVAHVVGAPDSPIVDDYERIRQARPSLVPPMPGRATPWVGVVALTANQALEVGGRRLRRIFPRGPLSTMDVSSAAASIGPRLRGQVEQLVATGRPIALSVTAGRDSRVSIAASRPYHDRITYFTYQRPGLRDNETDVTAAIAITSGLGLRHRLLDIPAAAAEQERLQARLAEASISANGRAYVGAYRLAFPRDTMHIRSNVGEIGRAYFRRHAVGQPMDPAARNLTPEMLARVWGYGVPPTPRVVEAFDDWMQAVGFADVEGIDPMDLLYWEHRMACWHANVLLASDFAFDTHVLFNARTILRDMLAVPLEDRRASRLFDALVCDLWPALQEWPYPEHAAAASTGVGGRSRAGALVHRLGRLRRR